MVQTTNYVFNEYIRKPTACGSDGPQASPGLLHYLSYFKLQGTHSEILRLSWGRPVICWRISHHVPIDVQDADQKTKEHWPTGESKRTETNITTPLLFFLPDNESLAGWE